MPRKAAPVLSIVAVLMMFLVLGLLSINPVVIGMGASLNGAPVGYGGPTPTVTLISGHPILSFTLGSTSTQSIQSSSVSSSTSATSQPTTTLRSTSQTITTSSGTSTTTSTTTSATSSTTIQTQSTTTVSAACSTGNASLLCFIVTVTYIVPNPATCAENPNIAQCKWDGTVQWESTNGAAGYINTLSMAGFQGSYSYAIYYYVGFLNEGYPISWTVRMYTSPSNSTMTFTLTSQTGAALVQQSTAQTGYYMLFGNYYPT